MKIILVVIGVAVLLIGLAATFAVLNKAPVNSKSLPLAGNTPTDESVVDAAKAPSLFERLFTNETDKSVGQYETFVYQDIPGVPAELTSLDVYPNAEASGKVLLFVHGGSWTGGDKSNIRNSQGLLDYFQSRGYVVAATNQRLMQDDDVPGVTFREQASDVAAAVRWVVDHAADYGGDPKEIVLMGYSSGAHLVSLVGTDNRYLLAEGLDRSALAAVIAMDVNAYDIPRAISEAASLNKAASARRLPVYFSDDLETQKEASPLTYVKNGQTYPSFLVIYAGGGEGEMQQLSMTQSQYFVDGLLAVGADASIHGDINKTHTQIVMDFNKSGNAITAAVDKFLVEQN